ncbi:sugar ABC transporter ATP-binding protein [Acidisoma sp. S159]|uniref:sugar ABC transporter ATP-binding protein n=1 Tax=Acidisoma sp. S159 TaxID=1747225 RepID=UPI00131DDC39|nr:sugar ABC transporter ATP-binding protein [Acidisoma sp. S159]
MSVRGDKLVKVFAGVPVLRDVDLAVKNGEVHALLGANGSGKSTLVKILSGVYQPDGGDITIGQRRLVAIPTPFEANALGIAVVHQEAPLIDTLSVAECIAVFRGYPLSGFGRVDWRKVYGDAENLLGKFDVHISPRRLAGSLAPADRALVALVIALDRVQSGLELLILDEVTASLPEDQAEVYLNRVEQIAAAGASVLMVTHRLAEVRRLAASSTILRGGQVVYSGPAASLTDEGMVTHMVGTVAILAEGKPAATSGAVARLWSVGAGGAQRPRPLPASAEAAPALAVTGLVSQALHDITFTLRPGEILGVAGLVDSGVVDLPDILGGVTERRAGRIAIDGREMPRSVGPREMIDAGMAVLPADRLRNGGVTTLSVAENILLPAMDRLWHRGTYERDVLACVIREFDVRPPSSRILFGKLSGGNQQKCILAKWLLTRPRVLVLDDPTSGVDPGAREKIFEILRDATSEGVGILFFSTEPEQLASLCDRVLVLRSGAIAQELTGAMLSRESISQWCYA